MPTNRAEYQKEWWAKKKQDPEWCAREKERSRIKSKKWAQENPRKRTDARLRNLYGISVDQFEKLEKEQGGCCAICERSLSEVKVCVDHDHSSDKVRGLLCFNCNVMLGHADDDPARMERAAAYIRVHRGVL